MKWNSDNINHQMYWTISLIYRKYFGNGYTNINEDCLYLNIYSPKVCIELKQLFKSFPVIGKYFFWIHDKYMIKNIVSGDNYKLSYNNTNLIQFFMFTCNSYIYKEHQPSEVFYSCHGLDSWRIFSKRIGIGIRRKNIGFKGGSYCSNC